MNPRRSSIVRMMAAIALFASALAILRAWVGEGWWFGELAPFTAIGLIGLALTVVSSGRLRRFFAGLATTGFVLGLTFWLAPSSIRDVVLKRIVFPIDTRIGLRPPGDSTTYLNYSLYWVFETEEHRRRLRPTRAPFVSQEAQAELGILELAFAVVGGLLAAIPRPRTARPSVTPNG